MVNFFKNQKIVEKEFNMTMGMYREAPRLPFWNFKDGFFQRFMDKASNFESHFGTFVVRTTLGHFYESTALVLEIPKLVKLHMDENNDFAQSNSVINAIKSKLQHMDKKQKQEISNIESLFGVKGLKEENVLTKAQLSITLIGGNNMQRVCELVGNENKL